MGRLRTLTILMTLGAWGATSFGAPPDDAPPDQGLAPAPAERPAPPVDPSRYVKAAASLAKKGDPKAADYIEAADRYRDMLSADDQATLDGLKTSRTDPAPANPPADAPPALGGGLTEPASAPGGTTKDRAVRMLAQARMALADGQIEQARRFAQDAQALKAEFKASEDHPGRVLDDIDRVASGISTRGGTPTDAKQQARWLLQGAREQLAAGNYEECEKKVNEARALNIHWTLFDDTPSKVAADLAKLKPKTTAPGTRGDRTQAQAKLKQAREMLASGDYDAAEGIASEVASWNVRFSLLGDNPQKVVAAARALRKRDLTRNAGKNAQPSEALYNAAVAQARQFYNAGRLDEAEAQARRALAMNVSPSLTAERAESVMHDVSIARERAATPSPSPTAVASAPALGAAPSDPAVSPAQAPVPIVPAEPPSAAAEKAGTQLLEQGDKAGAMAKFDEARTLHQQEEAAATGLAAPAAPPALAEAPPAQAPGLGDAPPAQPPALAPVGEPAAAPALSGPAAEPLASPAGPGGDALEQARALLTNGNYPAARTAALRAKDSGAGLAADEMLAQIGQTEQQAALQIYESAIAAIRKGTDADMGHARILLNELTSLEGLDESTQQKVQDLLYKLAPERAGKAEIGTVEDKDAVEAQKLNAEVGTKVAEARRLMETDPEKAIALLLATVDQVKASGCKPAVVKNMTHRLELAVETARKDKAAFDNKMKEKGFRAEIERKRLRILEADKARKERMKDLMARAEEATAAGRYEDAEKFYGMAADLDPNEVAAIAGRTMSRIKRHYERDLRTKSAKEETALEAWQLVDESAIVSANVQRNGIEYDKGFVALTKSRRDLARRMAPVKAPEIVETEKVLNKPISLNLEKKTLGEALQYLSEMTGLNIVTDTRALAEESLTMNSPVDFKVNDLKLKTALKLMLNNMSLTYRVDEGGVVMITSPQSNRQKTETRVYQVADLVIPLTNRTQNSAVNANPLGPQIPGGVLDPTNLQVQAAAMSNGGAFTPPVAMKTEEGQTFERTDRPDFMPLINLIKASVQPGTWNDFHGSSDMNGAYGQGAGMAGGGAGGEPDAQIGTITPFYLNISLIIRHTAEVHDDIVDLLRQLRRLQDLQVSIEVRFITVSDSFFEQIGVDFDFSIQSDAIGRKSTLANVNPAVLPGANTTGTNVTGGTTATTAGTNDYIVNPIRDHAIGSKAPLIVGHTGASTGNGNPGDFTPDFQLPFTQGSAGVISPFNALTGNTAATFGIAFLSDLEVYLFITAVQGDTRSNIVQAPKVTSFNGAQASVFNFTSRNYVATLTPIVGAGAVAFFPTIGQVPDGVTLIVTPVVSADRRYVRMTLAPNFITFTQFDTFTIPAAVGGGGLGGQSSAINAQVQLPVFSLTNVSTTVTVPDGGTVLLGGVKRLREQRIEAGVPILAKTPLIDRFFRNIGIGRTTDSLMLMVTPRIIILEEEEEKLGIPPVQNVTF